MGERNFNTKFSTRTERNNTYLFSKKTVLLIVVKPPDIKIGKSEQYKQYKDHMDKSQIILLKKDIFPDKCHEFWKHFPNKQNHFCKLAIWQNKKIGQI